jgi:hypothetical protein
VLLGGVEERRGHRRIAQVGLHGQSPPAGGPDARDDRLGALGPVLPVGLRGPGVDRIAHPQEAAKHRAPVPRQGDRGRRADPVIGARHDGRMPSRHHDRLLAGLTATVTVRR